MEKLRQLYDLLALFIYQASIVLQVAGFQVAKSLSILQSQGISHMLKYG